MATAADEGEEGLVESGSVEATEPVIFTPDD